MNNRFVDPSTKRKKSIVRDKLCCFNGIPLFSIVEINLIAACTRSCFFCPVSDQDFYKNIDIKGKMKIDFYSKILCDLKEINYTGKVLFSGFSEPLLHPELEQIIILTREYLPDSIIEIISNGDKLTSNKLANLVKNGLDTLSISMYDGSHQIEYFNKIIEESGIDTSHVILRRRYYENGNYGLTISNRAGLIDSNQYRDKNEEMILKLPLKKVCYYPFYMIKVDFNGDMDICSHDWQKKFIIGNINQNSIFELWQSNRLNEFKKRLANEDRNMEPCRTCDVYGDIIGKESFTAWSSLNLQYGIK